VRTALDCIPCFARQALEAARFVSDEPAVHERVLRDVMHRVAEMDLRKSPPVVAKHIHAELRELTGVADPYREIKDRFNRLALRMLGDLERQVAKAEDPLAMAVRLAIAGNVIDLGVDGTLSEDDIRRAIDNTLHEPFVGEIEALRDAIARAERIVVLLDNVGEIVFDRLLIEQLPLDRVTAAVRGRPILNDALLADAETAGITGLVPVIDNGSDVPGTLLSDCSDAFRQAFDDADLIIAKGQGNFETLSDHPANIWFLFKAKCPVIAGHVGLPVGTHICRPGIPSDALRRT
jgi:uncharacterized protein with ATP-grasp and redox domains